MTRPRTPVAEVGVVVLRDHPAQGEAGERLGRHQRRLHVGAADVLEVDVDAAGRGAQQRRGQVGLGLVVDDMVDADLLQEGDLLGAAGRADHRVALELGDLADDRAHRPGRAGDEHHVAVLQLGDLQQADVGGQARHAGDAQERLAAAGRGCPASAPPAAGALNASRQPKKLCTRSPAFSDGIVGGGDLADRAALHRLADLERRRVALHVVHPAAHVGVDRHPGVLHLHLAGAGSGRSTLASSKFAARGHADRAALQADFAGLGHGASPRLPSAPAWASDKHAFEPLAATRRRWRRSAVGC